MIAAKLWKGNFVKVNPKQKLSQKAEGLQNQFHYDNMSDTLNAIRAAFQEEMQDLSAQMAQMQLTIDDQGRLIKDVMDSSQESGRDKHKSKSGGRNAKLMNIPAI